MLGSLDHMSDDLAPHVDAVTEPAATPAEPVATASVEAPASPEAPEAAAVRTLDLDRVERDLADVEVALARLDTGSYWTDEVTGEPIADELLADEPTRRRLPAR